MARLTLHARRPRDGWLVRSASHRAGVCVVCALLWLGAAFALPAAARAQHDDWLGRDKALHYGASVGLGAGIYAASRFTVPSPVTRFALGTGAAFSVGVLKELWDASGRGTPSGRDLAWDAAGAFTGAALALLVDTLWHRRERRGGFWVGGPERTLDRARRSHRGSPPHPLGPARLCLVRETVGTPPFSRAR